VKMAAPRNKPAVRTGLFHAKRVRAQQDTVCAMSGSAHQTGLEPDAAYGLGAADCGQVLRGVYAVVVRGLRSPPPRRPIPGTMWLCASRSDLSRHRVIARNESVVIVQRRRISLRVPQRVERSP
jgi:hypothetical protein